MAVKLPLAVRKDVRDHWESVIPAYVERIKKCTGEDYTMEANTETIYAVASEKKQDRIGQIGQIAAEYFNQLIYGLESLTDKGKKTEAAAAFNLLVSTKKLVLVFDEAAFNYCGSRFVDGDLQIVIKPDNLYSNTSNVAEYLQRWIDMAMYKQHGLLPLSTTQAEAKQTQAAIKTAQASFKKMFGEDYTFSYDLLEVYKARHARWEDSERDEESWFRSYGGAHVPNMIAEYFSDVTKGLENKKFGKDEMLQEAFKESTEAKVVEFKLKSEQLPAGVYNGVEFEDGKFIVYTTPERFGVNINTSIVDKVVDLL